MSFVAERSAEACSCLSVGAACQAAGEYWNVAAVFAGRVESIERLESNGRFQFLRTRSVRFRLTEPFRGVDDADGGEVVVHTGSGGGDCGYPFKEGREYLVYASRAGNGVLTAGICSRTRPVEEAVSDLEYARAAVAGRAPAGRITGTVALVNETLDGRQRSEKPLPGIRVSFSSDGTEASAVTDTDGVFSTAQELAPGEYKVRVDAPVGHDASVHPETVRLSDPRACANVTVYLKRAQLPPPH
jgi:hypothetical protein